MVSGLCESGSIEQDADMVILLHRENAYEKGSARAGEADLIVGRNRRRHRHDHCGLPGPLFELRGQGAGVNRTN